MYLVDYDMFKDWILGGGITVAFPIAVTFYVGFSFS